MSKKFLVQKNLGQQSFLGRKNFWVKNFLVKKKFVIKNFLVKKFGIKKFLGQKQLGPKKFLSKKTGRVNPRGRIYDSFPPPKKIVGLKFCRLVLSCPKRSFVKKRNIGRVNPGRGGVDDLPPQENSKVKIVLGCC